MSFAPRILFAHPADVAAADQEAAALPAVKIRLRSLVPRGRMYLLRRTDAERVRYGFELEQRAERVIVR